MWRPPSASPLQVDEQTAPILVCFHLALAHAVKSVDSTSHLQMRSAFASLIEATHDVCAEFKGSSRVYHACLQREFHTSSPVTKFLPATVLAGEPPECATSRDSGLAEEHNNGRERSGGIGFIGHRHSVHTLHERYGMLSQPLAQVPPIARRGPS